CLPSVESRVLVDRRSQFVAAVSLAAIAGSLMFLAWRLVSFLHPPGPPTRYSMIYCYDQNTGELFEAPDAATPPLETASGPHRGMPAGVKAVVFSCGRCADPAQRFVGWLEAPVGDVPALQAPPPRADNATGEGSDTVIRRPDDDRWIYADSPAGLAIIRGATARCDGEGTLKFCHPPRRQLHEISPEFQHLAADTP
ncbi:MAG: hypothetical protein KDA41_19260, partial [Planctomycetales bacterium]|nr:hypothetical protein [Planctomycetales bacterium]